MGPLTASSLGKWCKCLKPLECEACSMHISSRTSTPHDLNPSGEPRRYCWHTISFSSAQSLSLPDQQASEAAFSGRTSAGRYTQAEFVSTLFQSIYRLKQSLERTNLNLQPAITVTFRSILTVLSCVILSTRIPRKAFLSRHHSQPSCTQVTVAVRGLPYMRLSSPKLTPGRLIWEMTESTPLWSVTLTCPVRVTMKHGQYK